MLVKDGLHALYRRTVTDTAYLALLVVIGVLTFMLITLGAVMLRQKRKHLTQSKLHDLEIARERNNRISSDVELKSTPWRKPPPPVPERRSSKAFTNHDSWFNPISAVPPVYHANVDHDESDIIERRVGLVRASLLRSAKSVRTLAAMQTSGSLRSTTKADRQAETQRSHESVGKSPIEDFTRRPVRDTTAEDFISAYQEQASPYDWHERQEAAQEDLEVYLRYQEQYSSSPERSVPGSARAPAPGLGIQQGQNFI